MEKNTQNLGGVTLMKKWMTLAFASVFALMLSVPAWSQSATGTTNQQTTADKKQEKDTKKEASKKQLLRRQRKRRRRKLRKTLIRRSRSTMESAMPSWHRYSA